MQAPSMYTFQGAVMVADITGRTSNFFLLHPFLYDPVSCSCCFSHCLLAALFATAADVKHYTLLALQNICVQPCMTKFYNMRRFHKAD